MRVLPNSTLTVIVFVCCVFLRRVAGRPQYFCSSYSTKTVFSKNYIFQRLVFLQKESTGSSFKILFLRLRNYLLSFFDAFILRNNIYGYRATKLPSPSKCDNPWLTRTRASRCRNSFAFGCVSLQCQTQDPASNPGS
jgi:hypothetical protein